MEIQKQQLVAPKGALLERKELSEHLKLYNYPEKALNLFNNCGTPLGSYLSKSCQCNNDMVEISVRCNKLFCSKCNPRRSKKLKVRLFSFFKDNRNTPYYQWRFLTISPKNLNGSLIDSIKDVRASLKRLLRRQYFKERVKGGVYSLEITNLNGTFHVHLHLLLYSRYLDNVYRGYCEFCNQNYFKKDKITKKFYCANKQCNQIYDGDIKTTLTDECKGAFNRSCFVDISSCLSPIKSVNYISKYITSSKDKFNSLDTFSEVIVNSYNKRLLIFFGKFYGRKISNRIYYHCNLCKSLIIYRFDSKISELYKQSIESTPPPGLLFNDKGVKMYSRPSIKKNKLTLKRVCVKCHSKHIVVNNLECSHKFICKRCKQS